MNYHTLADFRVEKQKELDELFTQVLAALSKEGLLPLEQVMQDGTKIKAQASIRSYRHEETIREHLARARQRVAEMGDPRNEETNPRTKQARRIYRFVKKAINSTVSSYLSKICVTPRPEAVSG